MRALLFVPILLLALVHSSKAAATLEYRVVDGQLAKRMDRYCATLWSDTDEVLLIEYRGHTYLLRTGFGDIGRACRID